MLSKTKVWFQDPWLWTVFLFLTFISLLMVTSASVAVANHNYGNPFYYTIKQLIFMPISFAGLFVARSIPVKKVESGLYFLLGLCFILSILVLIPGIGKSVNGSSRWLSFGFMRFQASEFVRLIVLLFVSSYCANNLNRVQKDYKGCVQLFLVVACFAGLFLLEPDFGAAFMLLSVSFAILFIAGVKLRYFITVGSLLLVSGLVLVIVTPYRMKRITSFLDPWSNQFDSGYQLTQSFMAVGKGGFWGAGLGASIQKMSYLPESHTDFLFAVIVEELGAIMAFVLIFLYLIMVARIWLWSYRAAKQDELFIAYFCFGSGFWIALQALFNISVNLGLVPTKGLTLPFLSYGGSSLLIHCMLMGIIMRMIHQIRSAHSNIYLRKGSNNFTRGDKDARV